MKRNKTLGKIAAALFWLLIWFTAAKAVGQELILPDPLVVIKTLISMCSDGDFWKAAFFTLIRIFAGFLSGVVIGTFLAAVTAASGILDALIAPMIKIVRAVPVASFIILAMLWIGKTYVPALICALIVVPVVFGAVRAAIDETDKNLLEMARSYRIGTWKTLRYIYAPSVFPSWCASAMTSLGLAWKSGVAAEVICLPRLAVGTNLYYSKIYLETPSLFAWTALVLMLSFLLEAILKSITESLVRNS